MKEFIFKAVQAYDRLSERMPAIGSFQPPRGWFSAYDKFMEGQLEGGELYPSQEIGPEPQGSITVLSGLNQARFQPWPAFWARSDNALLLGRTALWRDAEQKFCLEAAYHLKERRRLREDHPLARSWVTGTKNLPGAWMSIVSNWGEGKNYFHWILDNLTRLMVRETLPEETRILIPSNAHPYVKETLDLLELAHLTTPISGQPLRPERFYFCSPTAMTGVWNPMGFEWLRSKFAKYRSHEASGAPVFFTRRGVSRVPGQIEQIESIFRAHKFRIVECANLTVTEQIRISSEAPAVAGIHGAAMTNLLWARPGTPVMEIFSPEYLNGCYEQIAFQGNLAYTAMILGGNETMAHIEDWIGRSLQH